MTRHMKRVRDRSPSELISRPSHWIKSKDRIGRIVAVRKNEVTTPSASIRRLGELKSKTTCRRKGCGRKISRLAEKFKDPYCSRTCMAADRGLRIPSAEDLLGEEFRRAHS